LYVYTRGGILVKAKEKAPTGIGAEGGTQMTKRKVARKKMTMQDHRKFIHDELLRMARSGTPETLYEIMKMVWPERISPELAKRMDDFAAEKRATEQTGQRKRARPRSEFTRGVMGILAKSPDADGMTISRGLDLDGVLDKESRKFEDRYKGGGRKGLDSRYAKIRKEMRAKGV
jgi:hypothetical protein